MPAGARFCPTCGHNVHGLGDQRRVVTVLFADLAGFTGISESLDPESVKNLVDRCFAALAADITDHGGLVDKVVGDAIVALFGAPRAHEDDAERAVRAGLQMQRSIAGMAAAIGTPLQLRVGINTGEVLVGALRAGGDYTAMGDVVNVASRLQSSARPGTVVVGEATWSATNRVFDYKDLGPLQARGRDEPVQVWEALEALALPGRRPRRPTTPLVGRTQELGALQQSVAASVLRRRPGLVVLVGDAGIGKSRITEELTDWAACTHDALVLEGRCVPYGQANPWWPVAEAVRRACGIEGGDPADLAETKCRQAVASAVGRAAADPDVAQLSAGLMHLMGDESALRDVDPQRARQHGRKALQVLIAGLARQRPVIISLSEMHWADDMVLELIGSHLDRVAHLPIVLLLTGRPELLDRWTPAQGRHNLVVMHVDPLDPAACRALIDALLEGTASDSLADSLAARSGGNPLFLEELASLVAAGSNELPVTLRGIVAARVDHLPAEERTVLEDAAVVGRSGFLFTLRAMSGARAAAAEADHMIGQLVGRELLSVEAGRWQFRSDVVREVVYETLTKSERARRHWQLAEWICSE
ncbi:MAG TPA: adenylate/guanylate cyclase domain-containing protein, partial [Acidimicrobiales bacterium]|nr:adenylate/guanylate cyclase domain-containing protein [Acidimicrobiales bacterium]